MAWKSIRLELAETAEFPRGSASRIYLLRLPLDAAGALDRDELAARPAQATVRRFWPSQADLSGQVVATTQGWGFVFGEGAPLGQPAAPPLRLGAEAALVEPDGSRLPFRVVSLVQLAGR